MACCFVSRQKLKLGRDHPYLASAVRVDGTNQKAGVVRGCMASILQTITRWGSDKTYKMVAFVGLDLPSVRA